MSTQPLRLDSPPPTFPATGATLHRVAEEVLAPAQPGGAIALTTTPGGFGTPGDEQHAEPYAYVGPWTAEVSGDMWPASGYLGAELPYAQLPPATDTRAAALAIFAARHDALTETARSAS
ncbi:MAG: hypothetical protein ABI950_11790 [Solirubrobacteraceae bacterium]